MLSQTHTSTTPPQWLELKCSLAGNVSVKVYFGNRTIMALSCIWKKENLFLSWSGSYLSCIRLTWDLLLRLVCSVVLTDVGIGQSWPHGLFMSVPQSTRGAWTGTALSQSVWNQCLRNGFQISRLRCRVRGMELWSFVCCLR